MEHSEADPAGTAALAKVPVTVLTGFLGAGKTSRLNATLAAGTSRVAVIENELGSLGVDGAMVANTHDDGVVELNNGCLCCTSDVDLVSALEGLARRRADRPFDRLIIETTGLADVAPVVALLRDKDDPLAEDYVFDAVVAVVDAAGFKQWAATPGAGPAVAWASGFGGAAVASSAAVPPANLGLGREAARSTFWKQVGLADQLIISKADFAGENAVQELQATLAVVNPFVEPIVDGGSLIGPLPPPLSGGGEGPKNPRQLGHPRTMPPISSQKRRRAESHLHGVQALMIQPPAGRPLRRAPLRSLAEQLLQQAGDPNAAVPGDVWRIKGFVVVEGEGLVLLQGVGDQVALEPWPHGLAQSQPFLVMIGEGLEQQGLEQALAACATDVEQQQLHGGEPTH